MWGSKWSERADRRARQGRGLARRVFSFWTISEVLRTVTERTISNLAALNAEAGG